MAGAQIAGFLLLLDQKIVPVKEKGNPQCVV